MGLSPRVPALLSGRHWTPLRSYPLGQEQRCRVREAERRPRTTSRGSPRAAPVFTRPPPHMDTRSPAPLEHSCSDIRRKFGTGCYFQKAASLSEAGKGGRHSSQTPQGWCASRPGAWAVSEGVPIFREAQNVPDASRLPELKAPALGFKPTPHASGASCVRDKVSGPRLFGSGSSQARPALSVGGVRAHTCRHTAKSGFLFLSLSLF